MCVKKVPYWCKWLVAAVMIIIDILVIVSVFLGKGGSSYDAYRILYSVLLSTAVSAI